MDVILAQNNFTKFGVVSTVQKLRHVPPNSEKTGPLLTVTYYRWDEQEKLTVLLWDEHSRPRWIAGMIFRHTLEYY